MDGLGIAGVVFVLAVVAIIGFGICELFTVVTTLASIFAGSVTAFASPFSAADCDLISVAIREEVVVTGGLSSISDEFRKSLITFLKNHCPDNTIIFAPTNADADTFIAIRLRLLKEHNLSLEKHGIRGTTIPPSSGTPQ